MTTSASTSDSTPVATVHGSDDMYLRLINALPSGIAIHALGRILFANAAALRILGATDVSQIIGTSVMSYVHPDYRDIAQKRIKKSEQTQTQNPVVMEKFVRLDGSLFDVEVATLPLEFNGTPATLVMFNDVSAQHSTDAKLVASEELYRAVVTHAFDAILILDAQGRVLYMNPAAVELTGYPPEQLMGICMQDTYPPDKRSEFPQRLRDVNTAGRIAFERDLLRMDGSVIPVEMLVTRLPDGRLPQNIRDISARRQWEEVIVAKAKFAMTLLDNLLDIIVILKKDGTLSYMNKSVQKKLGYEPGEFLGHDIFSFMHPDDVKQVRESFARALSNLDHHEVIQYRFRAKDGVWHNLESIGTNLLNDPGVEGILVGSRDITDIVRAQETKFEADELARINKLMVGREQRILELKAQVEHLKTELSKAPKAQEPA